MKLAIVCGCGALMSRGGGDGEGALDAPGMRKSGGRAMRPVELKVKSHKGKD